MLKRLRRVDQIEDEVQIGGMDVIFSQPSHRHQPVLRHQYGEDHAVITVAILHFTTRRHDS